MGNSTSNIRKRSSRTATRRAIGRTRQKEEFNKRVNNWDDGWKDKQHGTMICRMTIRTMSTMTSGMVC